MQLKTQLDRAVDEVHQARAAVEKATLAYNRGEGTKGINDANMRLAEAHSRLREITDGRVRDVR